jgi:hypothetical protein
LKKAAEKTLYLKDGSFVTVVFRTNVPKLGTIVKLSTGKTRLLLYSTFMSCIAKKKVHQYNMFMP